MSSPTFLLLILLSFGKADHNKVINSLIHPQKGMASFYSSRFHGRRTAFGEVFNNKLLTAAHKSLPYNTMLEVTNLTNNKKVIVRVNDRGPRSRNRLVDVSHAAAREIGMIGQGIARVAVRVVGSGGKLDPVLANGDPKEISEMIMPFLNLQKESN